MKDRLVYALMDPTQEGPFRYGRFVFSHKPFYIGKGDTSRPNYHLKSALRGAKGPKANKIRKLARLGEEPLLRIMRRRLTDCEALDLERRVIFRVGRFPNGPLYNLTDGGEGTVGYKPPKSVVRKREAAKAARTPAQKKATIEQRRKALAETNAFKTPAQRKKSLDKFHTTLASKSIKAINKTRKRRSESRKQVWANWTPAQKAAREKKRLATLAARTPEQIAETNRRRSAAIKATKAKQKAQIAATSAAVWASYTPEQRKARGAKTGQAVRAAKQRKQT